MFYDILQGLCREHGLAVSAALKIMGISCGNMAYWRSGRLPKGKTLRRIAQFFDVPVDFLIGDRQKLYAAQQEKLLSLFASVPEDARETMLAAFERTVTDVQNQGEGMINHADRIKKVGQQSETGAD